MFWKSKSVNNNTLHNLSDDHVIQGPPRIGTVAVIKTKMDGQFIAKLNELGIWDAMSGGNYGYAQDNVTVVEVLQTPSQLGSDAQEVNPFEVGDRPEVTRVEVIDDTTGRVYTRPDAHSVQVHMQDDGHTMKVFLNTKEGRL